MSAVLVVLALGCILPVAGLAAILLAEVLAGWKVVPPARAASAHRASCVVLMPAHDEAAGIDATVRSVLRDLPAPGRLLVVADNCTDDTASRARAAGAEVVERSDPSLRGKGHALAFGIERLRSAPPDVVVILDADCIPGPGALSSLVAQASRSGLPAQALYLMLAPPDSPLRVRMAAFAWALKNEVRPLGLHRLGFPCQLMGSGMAFPWSTVAAVDFASGHLTEDLQLGVKLAAAGVAPRFCPEARVESWFPLGHDALRAQRTRWEHGHLSMILAGVPALLREALRSRRVGVLAMAFDLCIPPLALMTLLVLGAGVLAALVAGEGGAGRLAAAAAAGSAFALAASVLLAWWRVGRRWVRLPELLCVPVYVLKKLPLYAGFLLHRQREWVRTSRQQPPGAD